MRDMEAIAVLGFEPKPFYTPTELAAIVGVDPSTVMDWIHREELYAVKLGPKTYRIPLAAVVSRLNPDAAAPKRITVDGSDLAADEAGLKRRPVVAR
jgi:excisionase family DNA binding protein